MQNANKKFTNNHGHNILEFYNVLEKLNSPQVEQWLIFTIKKHCIRIISQAVESLKTED